MIKKRVYFLQQKKYFGYDDEDNEDIEECMIIGYFNSLESVIIAKDICHKNGIDECYLDLKCFDLILNNNQKYVYVLSHTYAKHQTDGTYTDYEYIFEPKINRQKCIELKNELLRSEKFKLSDDRDYCISPPDGFFIEKFKLNNIVYPIFVEI